MPRRRRSRIGSRRSATACEKAVDAAQRRDRGADDRRAQPPGERAHRRRGCGARAPCFGGRKSARSIASAVSGAASRRGMSAAGRRAEGHGRAEARRRAGRPRGARAGDPRRGDRDRREVAGARRRDRHASRSGSRRPTSASPRSASSGCLPREPPQARHGRRARRRARDGGGRLYRRRRRGRHDPGDDRHRRQDLGGKSFGALESGVVARVNDGDTITLRDGRKVRLAPDRRAGAVRRVLRPGRAPRGREADAAGHDGDPPEGSRARRPGHVRSPTCATSRRTALNMNAELVVFGAAVPYFFRGERGRYARDLLTAVDEARRKRIGLWKACPDAKLNPGSARSPALPDTFRGRGRAGGGNGLRDTVSQGRGRTTESRLLLRTL